MFEEEKKTDADMRNALMKLDAKIAQRKARKFARKNQREEEAKTEKTEEKRNHVEEEHGTLHLPARTSYIYLPARIP